MYVTAGRSHAAERRDMHTEFWWVNLNRRDSLEDIITNFMLVVKGIERNGSTDRKLDTSEDRIDQRDPV
jgi:hypothetical protein